MRSVESSHPMKVAIEFVPRKLPFMFSSNRDTMLIKSPPPPPNLLQHSVVLRCIGIDLIMHGNLIEDIITEDSPF